MKTKVVFMINSLAGGGAERILSLLINNIDRNKYDVSLCLTISKIITYPISTGIDIHYLDICNSPNIKWYEKIVSVVLAFIRSFHFHRKITLFKKEYCDVRLYMDNLFKRVALTRKFVKEKDPDVVVAFLFDSSLLALIAKLMDKGRLKVCCSDHCTLTQELRNFLPWTYLILPRFLYKVADAYIAVSDGVRNDLIEHYGLSASKIVTIYNGIDVETVRRHSVEPLENKLECLLAQDGNYKIVTVGRLSAPKGYAYLLKAFQIVVSHVPCRLVLIGEGELGVELKLLAKDLGIADKVLFLGWQKNPFNIMASCDLFVMSSGWEAFPNVLIEAMATGLPIVSTDCPTGPSEALDHGKYGVLVPVNDPLALADSIVKILKNDSLMTSLRESGPNRARKFDIRDMITSYEKLLDEVVGKPHEKNNFFGK